MSDLNNLYNNLTNFYNVNDENFKEFMSKFYEDVLTNHRDIKYIKEHLQNDIEEKVKKYVERLVDDGFGINANVDIKNKINWVLGALTDKGAYGTNNNRICTSTMQYAENDIFVSTDFSKYRISVYLYDKKDSTTIKANSGWITENSYKIVKGSYYMLQTGKIVEQTFTEVYNDCFNSLKMITIENLGITSNNTNSKDKPLLFTLSPAKTRTIMHRGYSRNAPDNTVASFTLAGQTAECWGIETDLRVLTDNTIVCFHNTDLDSVTNGTGDILEKSYTDIQNIVYNKGVNGLSQYPNQKIALFSDYLKICKKYGKVAVVELKPQSYINNIDKIVNMVNSYNMGNSVLYISFDQTYIDRVLELDKKAVVQKLYLANDKIDYDNYNYDSIGIEIEKWGQTDNNIIESNLRKLQAKGILISVWTTDTATTKRSLENKCVDFITTNLIN